jgi:hypothetical protein
MSSAQKIPVKFTQEQINWLEQMFPEICHLGDPQGMAFNAGKRFVLSVIRRQAKVETRYVVSGS